MTIGVAIVANSVALGFEVDFEEDNREFFLVLEHFFTFVFVAEMIIRIRNFFTNWSTSKF